MSDALTAAALIANRERAIAFLRRALAQAEHERDEARAEVADCYDSIARARALLDEKRERIAELEGLLAMRGES